MMIALAAFAAVTVGTAANAAADNNTNGSLGVIQVGTTSANPTVTTPAPVPGSASVPVTVGGSGGNSASSSTGTVQVGGGNTASRSTGVAQSGPIAAAPRVSTATPVGATGGSASVAIGGTGGNNASDSAGVAQVGGGNGAAGSAGVGQAGPLSAEVAAFFAAIGASFPFTLGGTGGNNGSQSDGVLQLGGGNSATGSTGAAQTGAFGFSPFVDAAGLTEIPSGTPVRIPASASGTPAVPVTTVGSPTPVRRTQRAPLTPRAAPRGTPSTGRFGVLGTGTLPFTGLSLALAFVLGLTLLAAGVAVRRTARA
jgi:hypothetical protein